jgi:hypothetical protein
VRWTVDGRIEGTRQQINGPSGDLRRLTRGIYFQWIRRSVESWGKLGKSCRNVEKYIPLGGYFPSSLRKVELLFASHPAAVISFGNDGGYEDMKTHPTVTFLPR